MKRIIPVLLTAIFVVGSVGMGLSADFQKGKDAYDNEDYAIALRIFKPLAEQGHVKAQNKLGDMYSVKGRGVRRNYKTAVKWYRLAAEQGDAEAQVNLGHMHANGLGVPVSGRETLKWWKLAAKQGYADGQYFMGDLYETGWGVLRNYKSALKWYRLAAETYSVQGKIDAKGIERAKKKIDQLTHYYKGFDAYKAGDYATALGIFKPLAEEGGEYSWSYHTDARYYMGLMYANGHGVPEDDETAKKWYKSAANGGMPHGHSKAKYELEELNKPWWQFW